MANEEQLKILRQGATAWNKWRAENLKTKIDLSKADLSGANLRMANLREVNLRGAALKGAHLVLSDLSWSDLREADFHEANLRETGLVCAKLNGANLEMTNLYKARLHRAILKNADLAGANLRSAVLSKADLSGSHLIFASLIDTNLEGAILTGCHIYGISTWDLKLKDADQKDLIITPLDEPAITVDNIDVAQFIYLLLHNENIRHVIDTITSKVVLILGRFTSERKSILDALKEELRKHDYLPVLFDFEGPTTRDIMESVSTLAHMSRFIIVDITDPKSVPAELAHIVPLLPSVPVQPLIYGPEKEYGMFNHIMESPSVLEPYRYENQNELLASIEEKVIAPAESKVNEIRGG
jgi:hypothetical protein